MPPEIVHADIADRIATITLDSPGNRNALSRQLLDELSSHLASAKIDDSVRGVVLTATGTTFCSGADLKAGTVPAGAGGVTLPQIMTEMWMYPKPVIVMLNGHVRAGGIGLVAAADIVVAAKNASFAFSEVRIGVAPAIISVLCTRRMHPRAIARYFLTGEVFDADAAVASGLVTVAIDADQLQDATDEILTSVRVTEPTAVRVTKELLRDIPALEISEGYVKAEAISAELFASETAAEGRSAFRGKRPPRWAT